MIGTDLVVILGSDLANNQPVTTKYLHYAKRQGTRIVVVNPMREPGLERYWVPCDLRSALFGTRLMDDFFQVARGRRHRVHARRAQAPDRARRVGTATSSSGAPTGFEALRAHGRRALPWETLETRRRAHARRHGSASPTQYARAKTAVFVYSMGLTQHRFGVDNVKAIVNLALARGMLGREKCGIMPIRGHSGVQGGGECGVDPDKYPGGFEVANESDRRALRGRCGAVRSRRGRAIARSRCSRPRTTARSTCSTRSAATCSRPCPTATTCAKRSRACGSASTRTSCSTPRRCSTGRTVLLLPAQTRYETPGGGTATSTERRIRFSPEIAGPRIAEARPEWEIPVQLAIAARPELAPLLAWTRHRPTSAARWRGRCRSTPAVEALEREGAVGAVGRRAPLRATASRRMPEGRARFTPVPLPEIEIPPGHFYLTHAARQAVQQHGARAARLPDGKLATGATCS